jgi:hypothetical protein
MIVPKPPPLPLATLTQLLNLSNVAYVPLGTLLATTRSEADPLFSTHLGTKKQVAAARAAEEARRKKKEEAERAARLLQEQQNSKPNSRRGSASSRRGSSAGSRGSRGGEGSDVFSIPDYVKNPYAALFIGKKANGDDGGRARRRSRRKSDVRRRSSAAWQMPSEDELERDAMPRQLHPSMFCREAKYDLLERERDAVAKRIVGGKEFNPTVNTVSVTTYGDTKVANGTDKMGAVKRTVLDPSVSAQQKSTPRHMASLLRKHNEAADGHVNTNGETIDWTSDHYAGEASPPGATSRGKQPSGSHVKASPPRRPELSRSLVPIEIVHSSSVMVVDDGADLRSLLHKPRLPRALEGLVHRADGGEQPATARRAPTRAVFEIAMLQHRDGTISVKPNPPRYQQLLVQQ